MTELTAWARHMDETRAYRARAMASDAFQDLLFADLNAPEEDVHPAAAFAPVTRLLREAEHRHARDGWTLLEDAVAYVSQASKGTEYPSRYQCRTWRQVLKRSDAFDVAQQALPHRSGSVTAYRSRPAADTSTDSGTASM